ncbi:3-polyprenyl-4-hydroxybenzoate carboxy-lyase UbiX [invertebrate metagenome]|uniref:flavin prenyltransferase n=1 Tax=invertebrate metagenome TaxID=1711999 RepID=A0A484H5Z4_9ZZZZ
MKQRARLIAGISGASGIVYGLRLLTMARQLGVETHLVMTAAAEVALARETSYKVVDVQAMADACHQVHDLTASLASGAFQTIGMVIAPCSIRSLSEIATGVTSNLLTRAADVTLKERRRLVLMVRESPLHRGHLRAMLRVTELGGIVAPPVPAFYIRPQSLDVVVDYTVGRILDLFGLDSGFPRWGETRGEER